MSTPTPRSNIDEHPLVFHTASPAEAAVEPLAWSAHEPLVGASSLYLRIQPDPLYECVCVCQREAEEIIGEKRGSSPTFQFPFLPSKKHLCFIHVEFLNELAPNQPLTSGQNFI